MSLAESLSSRSTLGRARRQAWCTTAATAFVLTFPTACGNSFTGADSRSDQPQGGEGGVESGSGGSPPGGASGSISSGAGGEADGGEGATSSGSGGTAGTNATGGGAGMDGTGGTGLTGSGGSPQGGSSTAGQATGGASGAAGSGASAGAGGQRCSPTVIASALPGTFTWESFTDSVFTGSQNACTYCNSTPCGPCSITWGTPAQSGEDLLVPIMMGLCSVPARYGTCGVPSGQGACTLGATVMNAVATLRLTRTATGFEVADATLAGSWDGTGCADYFSDERLSTSVNSSLRASLVDRSKSCP